MNETERDLLKRLAAAQAVIAKLREALKDMNNGWKYIRATHGDLYGVGWDRAQGKADEALALPSDDTAMREMLAEQLEKAAKVCETSDRYRGDYFAQKIRAMPLVIDKDES